MKILALGDNALFLKNFRERTRPALVISSATVASLILVLIVAACLMVETDFSRPSWPGFAFFWLAICQGATILILGSISVSSMVLDERRAGTLDFHRTSPTPPFDQILGLVLGAPILEWCVVGVTAVIATFLALAGGISLMMVVLFYVSLILTALLFHTLILFASLAFERKRGRTYESSWPVLVFVLAGLASLAGVSGRVSVLYHATCAPAYVRIGEEVFRNSESDVAPQAFIFFHTRLPSIILEAIVQLPLLVLFWIGAMRKMAHPERPTLSKVQSLILVAFLLTLFVGTVLPFLPTEGPRVPRHTIQAIMGIFLYFVLMLGLFGVAPVTPSRLFHLKGLRRMRKQGRTRLPRLGDYGSNVTWLGVFLIFALATHCVFLWPALEGTMRAECLALVGLVAAYVAWFAGALEVFRLGKYHAKKSLFTVAVGIPWLFLPMFGFVLAISDLLRWLMPYFLSLSPIFGTIVFAGIVFENSTGAGTLQLESVWFALVVNVLLACGMLFAAHRARRNLLEGE